jgi:phage gpG-like protein
MPAAEILSLDGLEAWALKSGRDLASLSFEVPLKKCNVLMQSETKRNFAESHAPDGTPWAPIQPRVRGGSLPLRDTGLLGASVTGPGKGHVEQITHRELIYGTNLDRAAIHQYGGVIRPKNAQALSIPLTKEAVRAGSPRNFPRPLGMVKRPGHPPLLVENQGDKKSVFHYVLLKSVTIIARPFLGFGKRAVDGVGQIFAEFIGRKIT